MSRAEAIEPHLHGTITRSQTARQHRLQHIHRTASVFPGPMLVGEALDTTLSQIIVKCRLFTPPRGDEARRDRLVETRRFLGNRIRSTRLRPMKSRRAVFLTVPQPLKFVPTVPAIRHPNAHKGRNSVKSAGCCIRIPKQSHPSKVSQCGSAVEPTFGPRS